MKQIKFTSPIKKISSVELLRMKNYCKDDFKFIPPSNINIQNKRTKNGWQIIKLRSPTIRKQISNYDIDNFKFMNELRKKAEHSKRYKKILNRMLTKSLISSSKKQQVKSNWLSKKNL